MNDAMNHDADLAWALEYYAEAKYETAFIRGNIARFGHIKFSDLTPESIESQDSYDRLARWQVYEVPQGTGDYQIQPRSNGFTTLAEAVACCEAMIAAGDPRKFSWVILTPLRDSGEDCFAEGV